jgi:transcriptional regulator with XRE-family HTH domain
MNTRSLSDMSLLSDNVPLPPAGLPAMMGQTPIAAETMPVTTETVLTVTRTLPVDRENGSEPVETRRPLHRLQAVRKAECISRRNLARKLKTSVAQVLEQEEPGSDMTLSTLYQWQRALGVPVAELLVEQDDDELSQPILKRSRMLRLMKTAQSIEEMATQPRVRRMTQNLIEQLIEIMPELQDVGPWPLVGQRRSLSDLGRAVERFLPMSAFSEGE